MKLKQTTVLKLNKKLVWEQLMKPAVLDYISWPILKFRYYSTAPLVWQTGSYTTELKLFGFIPFGQQSIEIEFVHSNNDTLILRDNGHGQHIKKWDHWIYLLDKDEQTTQYTDEVEIGAGLITPFI